MAADIPTTLSGWSSTPGSNGPDTTDPIGPNSLAENLQVIQSVVRNLHNHGTIASAATCDIGTVESESLGITGTTTITSLGTVSAGIRKKVRFAGALTLTHNATSMILTGGANIGTEAGDWCVVESLGSGNWRMIGYERASGLPLNGLPAGFRNKIIGGDFTTNPWQRGTSFVNPASGSYLADRFQQNYVGTMIYTVTKTADAPTVAEAGVFSQHCLHLDVTTADASMAAGDHCVITQAIEGLNAASSGFGQAGTRYVTLSFWVKATKTGIYCVALRNSGFTRSYVSEYTVNASNTWEKKTITIPVDTTGTWLYDNTVGLYVSFTIASGSTYGSATNNTWSANNYFATANQVNGVDSVANDFKLALIQLEAGSVATPFETRSVGTELNLCQRYYEIDTGGYGGIFNGNVTSGVTYYSSQKYSVPKRTAPTITLTNAGASNFPTTPGTPVTLVYSFYEPRVANGTGAGLFFSSWIASAEL